MNILVVNWQDIKNPLGGGAEVHFHEIFKRIAAKGHSVTLFCSRFEGSSQEEVIDGIRVLRAGGRSFFNFAVPRWYRSRFAHEKFDVVVDDLNKIPFFTPLYVRAPLVTIVHHLFGTSIFREAIFPAALYVWGAEQAALPLYRSTLFAAVSPSTQRELESHGVPGDRIELVYNAVDHALFTPSGNTPAGPFTVGYLGRIKHYKSVDHLVRAFAMFKKFREDARLVIVGDGDAVQGLKRLADNLGIAEAVEFTGFVSAEEKVRRLRTMHVVVNPSAKEGWGLTVVEANACGVPVIASDVPGLRDSVINERTGILYPYGEIKILTDLLKRVADDGMLRDRLAEGAREWAKKFTWDASATAMLRVMERAIREKSASG